MIYHVQANFRKNTAAAFLTKLTDGTVANQRPDGSELVASMARAVVNSEGQIEWSEMCFCSSPLHHERTTVLDLHFDNIVTEPINTIKNYDGQPFMDYLQQIA